MSRQSASSLIFLKWLESLSPEMFVSFANFVGAKYDRKKFVFWSNKFNFLENEIKSGYYDSYNRLGKQKALRDLRRAKDNYMDIRGDIEYEIGKKFIGDSKIIMKFLSKGKDDEYEGDL